jgi:serine/threonine protein kinase
MEMTLQQRLRLGDVAFELQDQWMLEVCEGMQFLHGKGVIQGDVGSQNILLDAEAHAKICDFAGSMIDGKDAWISYQVRNQHPKYMGKQPCVESDIFALGSVIFEIVTGRAPYEELSDSSVLCKFRDGEFPVDRINRHDIMRIVESCWKGEYVKVSEVIEDLMESRDGDSY